MPIFTPVPGERLGRGQPAERVRGQHALDAVGRHRARDPLGVPGSSSTIGSTRELPPTSRIARARPSQRASSPVLPTCWLMHSAPPHARRRRAAGPPPARRGPRAGRRGASTPSALEEVAAGVDRDDRDAGLHGAPDRRRQARLRDRDDEPVGLGRDRLVDQRAHPLERVDVGRLVVDEHVEPARGGVDAVADDRPELARGRAVRDDRDPHRAVGGRRARRGRAGRRARDLHALLAHDRRARRSRRARARRSDAASHLIRTGILARSRVPPPTGLSISSVPPTAATRSSSPRSPPPASGSTPPTPSSATSDHQHPARRAAPRPARSTRPRIGRRWSAPRRRGSTRPPRPAPGSRSGHLDVGLDRHRRRARRASRSPAPARGR